MAKFNYEKFVKKAIIEQFKEMCFNTNCETIEITSTTATVQKFTLTYVKNNTVFSVDGLITMTRACIRFFPESVKEVAKIEK